jgi:hypothetical protein
MTAGRPDRVTRYSLRWRLPALIAALLAVVITTVLAIAYRHVKTAVRHPVGRGRTGA